MNVLFLLMLFCDKVAEGQMKQLDATVFQAVDLDVPQNMLHFSVVKVPQHGRIINCISNRLEQVATHHSVVMDFTMADITNGTLSYDYHGAFIYFSLLGSQNQIAELFKMFKPVFQGSFNILANWLLTIMCIFI